MRITTALLSCAILFSGTVNAEESAKTEATKGVVKEVPKVQITALSTAPAKQPMTDAEIAVQIKARIAAMRAQRAAHAANTTKVRDVPGDTEMHRAAAGLETNHWTYEGEGGPARWGKLNPGWAKCDTGTRQSPIDIRDGIKVDLEPVVFDYKPTGFNVIDNGHTVQVNMGEGNFITLTGRTFELVQFHFHRPSEERIDGRGFEMVAHLVHKNSEGKLAVVAVLMETGTPHNVVQSVWNNLPLEKNEPVLPVTTLDMSKLLPQRRDYFTYMGSLTTPPCSEGVLWIVLKEPVQVSAAQLAIFAKLYPMNARPVQQSSGRLIKESN